MGSYQVPPEWAEYGARFESDGLLYLAEWRRGFTVHELRAMFFITQQVRTLESEVKNLTSTVERQAGELAAAERRAWWYRSQLVAESRLGMALAHIHGQGREPPFHRQRLA